MGNVGSTPDAGASLYLSDPRRFTISSLIISSPRKRSSINIVPNTFPPTRISASRPLGDTSLVEFIQDIELLSNAPGPSFLLKLTNDDELVFNFTFAIHRQEQQAAQTTASPGAAEPDAGPLLNTQVNGLTYVYASTPREVENLVTREFHADPNLHKNANVELLGDFETGGSTSVSFGWSWNWKPPKTAEDKAGGWRNSCSFVEYDQHNHRLLTLASFSFFVANTSPSPIAPNSPKAILLSPPSKLRVVSAQSVEPQVSSQGLDEPTSPLASTFVEGIHTPSMAPAAPKEPIKVDIPCPRPGDNMSLADDGPVFRATIKALELKTGTMKSQVKKLIKQAEHAHNAQVEANEAFVSFTDALKEISSTNANAVQPALEHYFEKIAREILNYERQNAALLQKNVVEPMMKLYQLDIKQAEAKKRDFEEESKDFYSYVSRYLGQRQDSSKAKQSDTKYQSKRRVFELRRFDYASFLQDLTGGRKEQEVLSHLTRYADAQARCFLATSKRVDDLLPQLEALSSEVQEADKEYQFQRREREEKRRLLEKSSVSYNEPDQSPVVLATSLGVVPNGSQAQPESELGQADSTGGQSRAAVTGTSSGTASANDLSRSPGSLAHSTSVSSPSQSHKFRGIRDLEERTTSSTGSTGERAQRREGLLWALNRPGGHVDPRNLNKQGWHKFWIVLDQGTLAEYSNWKQKLDLHMDPIDLRMASVREARNAERRFCFEVITPQYKRVYQATSEEDMNSWIMAINNALQSAVEGRAFRDKPVPSPYDSTFNRRDIGSVLTGKSSSLGHGHHHNSQHGNNSMSRRVTLTDTRPKAGRRTNFTEDPERLLQMLRDSDQGNAWCADCASLSKVEWVSINLGIILCIECSGIHRSLGTHISKVRSLTLDVTSFTTDIVELLLLVGNRVSNMVWEARMDPAVKPAPNATREQRLQFVTAKYATRSFVEPISSTLSRYSTADETLIAAIKKNEIQQVIYALALRANPNVMDKMRGTHAIYLALAAADPASPSTPPPYPLSTPLLNSGPAAAAPDAKVVPFPIAELLVQNGAEIPNTMPAFPLSRAAQAYLDMKRGRHFVGCSVALGPSTAMSSAAANISYDGVAGSALSPTATVTGVMSGVSGLVSSATEKMQREREARLQKRVSAGGRLAKSPIPER